MSKLIIITLFTILTTMSLLNSSSAVADTLTSLHEKSGPTINAEGTINTLTGNNNTMGV